MESLLQTDLVHKVSFPPLFLITHLLYPLAFHLQLNISDMLSLEIHLNVAKVPLKQTRCAAPCRQLYERKSFGYATQVPMPPNHMDLTLTSLFLLIEA